MKPRETLTVQLDELTPDPDQVRRVFTDEELAGLARSLQEVGQLQPILAYRRSGKLVILDGERRWRAAKLARLAAVEVVIVDEPREQGSRLQLQLIANVQREDLSPVEKARAIQKLMQETSWTAAKVAISLGLSPASVSRTLALLSLPEEVQAKIGSKELTASAGYQLARSGEAKPTVPPGHSVTGEADPVPPASVRQRWSRHVAHLSGGRQVVLQGAELLSLDDLVSWVEDLLAKARKLRSKGKELTTFLAQLKLDAKHVDPVRKDAVGEGEVQPC